MHDDLSELKERVEWCRQKSEALVPQVAQLGGHSVAHRVHISAHGTGGVLGKLLAHPPVALRSEVGMILNEQRSVLDALACSLATRNRANHTNDVYFPITKTKAGFYEKLGQRKIRKLSADARQKIEDLKPWWPSKDCPEDGNPALFLLHEADRIRKHQNLLRWGCMGGVFPAGSGQIGMMSGHPVIFEEVGREEQLAMFRNVTCQIGVRFDLVYREPDTLRGRPVLPCLFEFNQTVAGIVDLFA